MSSVLDMLLGGEDPVSVMQPGPVRAERKGGLFSAIVGAAQNYNPVSLVSDAVANYRALAGNTDAPETQPLTTEWVAKKLGVDTEDPAYQTGAWMPGPGSLSKLGMLAGAGVVTRASKVPGATHTWKGKDGILRANIDDRNARLVNTLPTKGSIRLGDLLQHDKLYEVYPEMRDIPVERMDPRIATMYGEGTKAAYTTRNGKPVILLNPNGTPKEWVRSLLHESAHDVQRREGLLSGSNPAEAKALADKIRLEFAVRMGEDDKGAMSLLRTIKKKYGIDISKHPEKVLDSKGKPVLDKKGNQVFRDPLAEQLYTKQQGEQDAFLTQDIYEHQMSRQKPYMTAEEFASTPQPPLSYRFGAPTDKDTFFEEVFGHGALDDTVDMTTSGTRGFRGKITDRSILGY